MIPLQTKHVISTGDSVAVGPESENHIIQLVETQGISCKNNENKTICYFTLRKNNNFVEFGYSKNEKTHTLHIKSKSCCVCTEVSEEFLRCNDNVRHYICDKCLILTAVLNSKRCPECRKEFRIPKRLLRLYCNKLEIEKCRIERENDELTDTNETILQRDNIATQQRVFTRLVFNQLLDRRDQRYNRNHFFNFLAIGIFFILTAIKMSDYKPI